MNKLSSIAYYVTDKISSNDISLSEYVTTDCILQNKKGREVASNLPPQPCCLTRYQRGDVLIANIRPYLKKVWFADIDGGASSDVLVCRAKEGHSPSFLYAVLLQDSFFDYVMQGAKGSKMPRGDKEQILRYEMPILSCSEESIGTFFLNLDQKIRLNEQINQNLEAMAKQLYDYWFVQFDFPNKDGKPYKSSGGEMVWNEKLKRMIPKEWTNANIYQLASISKETVNPQAQPNELFKHYSLPEYDKTGTYAEEYGIDIQSAKFIVTNNCILVSKLNPWTSRVICGNRGSNQICSTEFVVWNPASLKTKGFLFMLAKSAKFIEYCTQGATGTSHSHRRINPELMMKFDFPYNSEIAIKFSLLIENIIVHLHNNIAQLKVLTKQRDELLPLLMNGQITIE
ncbi:restriction endonuclease subunit S [Bacteroides intestinalis]|uniref:restriction endonuclease subunit S n=1 Tax=Bacteroides intestinalis TaxID=329854 RepID=UPI001D074BBE|nr:restriction endonuclease subunit S [Bacteroides intestinalis]MCB6678212.1 restriction endonuclease subunit S [Bacteroides intestinalis]MCB7015761.1 restriction endonuclease subunit S [Bacteroides intestinalis]MCG4702843.1 restriction endonuclease subunit S [Bacteroides intestinalis]MCG4735474.1 restriction endonuclease subunit S [Bacteroides intestinalis]